MVFVVVLLPGGLERLLSTLKDFTASSPFSIFQFLKKN